MVFETPKGWTRGAVINIAAILPEGATVARQPRARGAVQLTAVASPRGTEIAKLRQSGSLKLVFPRAETDLQAVLVNTAGGITGGDRFDVDLHAGPGARLTVTTQAAERAYRAQPMSTGRLDTRLTIGVGARLCWLPQETLLFEGSTLRRTLEVDMAEDATFLMVEPLVFGRAAMGEILRDARLTDAITVRVGGRPAYLDRLTLSGDVTAHLSRPTIAGGAGALATLLYVGAEAEAHLGPVRAMLEETAGASLIGPDLLAVRMLAPDSFDLRRSLIPVLTRLGGQALPRAWMI